MLPAERKESLWNCINGKTVCECDSVILFIDEADLTFHPEWQRQLIAILTTFLPKVFQDPYYVGTQSGCKKIQIIMATHSPIILGDFPSTSVIYLRRNSDLVMVNDNGSFQTFGQNIYTILKDGFYLKNGAIGEFARHKIDDVLKDIKEIHDYNISLQQSQNNETMSKQKLEYLERKLEEHKIKTVQYLSDGIIKNKLKEEIDICQHILYNLLEKKLQKTVKEGDISKRNQYLEEENKKLRKQIEELQKKMENDK